MTDREREKKPSTWTPAAGMPDARLQSPAVARNTAPLVAVLRDLLPAEGRVLEVACGTGEHALAFAKAFPALDWQPADPDPRAHASAVAWAAEGPDNLRWPLLADVETAIAEALRSGPLGAIVAINLIHIAPWSVTEVLVAAAGKALSEKGTLFLYGPFKRNGRHTADSNARFDESLRTQDPEWGVRDLAAVASLAAKAGFDRPDVTEMPANNLSVAFHRNR